MGDLREWLRGEGVPEAHLETYGRAAQRLSDEAAGGRILPKHLDMAIATAEQEGATVQQLANLKRMGEAVLRFERLEAEPSSRQPSSAPDLQPLAPATGSLASNARSTVATGPGVCRMCGGSFVVGRGELHISEFGGVGSAISAAIGYFFGLIGGLTILAGIGSLGMLVAALGTRLKCSSCGVSPDRDEVDAELVGKMWMQRGGLVLGALALAGLAIFLVLTWIGLAAQRSLGR